MGTYSNFNVQVIREGSIPSNAKSVSTVELKLFSYGAGTEENPYRIKNATELLNITYFKNANYILTASIRMTDVDYTERLSTYNAIISDTFSGVLDGNNFSIFDFNTNTTNKTDIINLNDVNNFALFGTLNNAEIKNLNIGEQNIQMILTNTFANNNSNVVNLSMIATGVNNNSIIKSISFPQHYLKKFLLLNPAVINLQAALPLVNHSILTSFLVLTSILSTKNLATTSG